MSNPSIKKPLNNNGLTNVSGVQPATQKQLSLDLKIEKQKEINGVGMGVLNDGTPFLTGRGLSRFCGVGHSVIQDISNEWGGGSPRDIKIRGILDRIGVEDLVKPYIEISDGGSVFYAYPDFVSMAILEYYAFESAPPKEEAKSNFRVLARTALREIIYHELGYQKIDQWKQFHDRVSLTYNSVPNGYFGIFKEISDMIVHLGQKGLHIDEHFVPDISVGIHWGKHWKANGFDGVYGARIKYEHNYPDYFKQALSNPQDANCYPEAALGEFRRWFRENYIGEGKFKSYLSGKVASKELPVSFAQLAISSYESNGE